jgi:thioredoxin-like negative regulator of GroEL
VPTVYAVFRGQGVDSFQGLPEASKIDQMFETIDKIVAISDKQDRAYEYLSNGKKFLSEGKYD